MALLSINHICIAGLGVVVPKHIERNFDLSYLNEDEKTNLVRTTGIEHRRIADDSTTAADLCMKASKNILNALNWKAEDIDILVFVTQTPDYTIPGTSMYIQHELGIKNTCMAFDINQGCAGYVYGLSIISSLMSSGKFKKGLLLVGDTITKTIDKTDKSLVPVFSDAGSCTALEYNESKHSKMMFNLQTDGMGYDKIIVKEGGARVPAIQNSCHLQMNGQDIFNFGLKEVAANVTVLLNEFGLKNEEIDYFVMHQANLLLNETIRKKLNMEPNKTLYSLKEFGNTSCASIPVSIAANASLINEQGDSKLLLAGFGVGLSWGSAIVDFNKVKCLPVDEY